MSDYISKSDVIKIIEKETKRTNSFIEHNTQLRIKIAVEKLPTLDEKEIIRKAFERVVERLEEEATAYEDNFGELIDCIPEHIAIEIVKEEGGIE